MKRNKLMTTDDLLSMSHWLRVFADNIENYARGSESKGDRVPGVSRTKALDRAMSELESLSDTLEDYLPRWKPMTAETPNKPKTLTVRPLRSPAKATP